MSIILKITTFSLDSDKMVILHYVLIIIIVPTTEPPHEAMLGPSVAYMKGQKGTLISLLAKKRQLSLGWAYGVFALSSTNKTIYHFRSELVFAQNSFFVVL